MVRALLLHTIRSPFENNSILVVRSLFTQWKDTCKPSIVHIWDMIKGTPHIRKTVSFQALSKLPIPPNPLSPQFGQVVQLFWDVKNDVLMRITETSNNDYDNDWSNNCDYNFGT